MEGKLKGKESEREANYGRLWTLGNKQGVTEERRVGG